ncbi:hypothetical protein AB1A81_13175 [Bdellovibrio bacteriovorus]|uniref:Lipoprotein n=1 Tax=Bdellovibrio bacteriovorus (strain ATCC 15356 / DSM 50701 / NCIMB 9529 / HD100) TaxID=264462 RepID=Q6MJB1_BDEBA|nr:hypothetical protein [Bdellovibrio bacteriovorus]AHZ85357.1 hypothetical protein EP01_10460 [Bdellovibrio bacteriovorus]BEV69251.1 hypothetical protein Bb109J_c2671 [Bdellovibrio bacteriovorus]CAE80650.1 hypothetical protein predicted by Glimmer/Critica [Bdellovibrio bacteriovorus HD100]
MFRNLSICLFPLMLLLTGCSIEASLQDLAGLRGPKLPPGIDITNKQPIAGVVTDPAICDFAKSEILVGPSGKADGVTELQFAIQLMNSDNTVVQGYVPQFTVIKGLGTVPVVCTASDEYGFSVCSIRSSEPGIKTLQVTNLADYQGQKDLLFDAIVKEATRIVSSGGEVTVATHPSGWQMTGSVGSQYGDIMVQKNGYKLRLGAAGIAIE